VRDEFVPLEVFLRPAPRAAEIPAIEASAVATVAPESAEAIGAARRFRAGLADAVDVAVARLLPGIARDVLARELRLAPADIAAIVAAALHRFGDEMPLVLRAAPADVAALADVSIAVVADDTLHRGDVVFELHSGTIDLRMESRLQAVLYASG